MISTKPFCSNLSGMGLIVLLITLYTNAFSQQKQYFNSYWVPIKYAEFATYYRTVKEEDGKFIVKTYHLPDEKLLTAAECQSVEPQLVYNGKVIHYYDNDKVKNQGFYKEGKPWGVFKYFREDGKPTSEQSCHGDDCKYIQYWSDNGEPSLIKGMGVGARYDKEKKRTNQFEFQDSVIVCSYTIRPAKGDTVYYNYGLESPFFKKGHQALHEKMGKYPDEAQRNGVGGKVVVGFVVNLKGELEDISIIEGIGHGCDELVLDCMKKNATGWEPARYKGKPVKAEAMIPFTFKAE